MIKKFDLNERLIEFASTIIDISEALPKTFAGNHIAGQLVRSGTSPALHYGEAQSAESRNDFIHKMKVSRQRITRDVQLLTTDQQKEMVQGGAADKDFRRKQPVNFNFRKKH